MLYDKLVSNLEAIFIGKAYSYLGMIVTVESIDVHSRHFAVWLRCTYDDAGYKTAVALADIGTLLAEGTLLEMEC